MKKINSMDCSFLLIIGISIMGLIILMGAIGIMAYVPGLIKTPIGYKLVFVSNDPAYYKDVSFSVDISYKKINILGEFVYEEEKLSCRYILCASSMNLLKMGGSPDYLYVGEKAFCDNEYKKAWRGGNGYGQLYYRCKNNIIKKTNFIDSDTNIIMNELLIRAKAYVDGYNNAINLIEEIK